MSDTDSGDNKIGGRGFGGRGAGGGRSSVRQSFSHGRSKAVVVETKRKRILTPHDGAPKTAAAAAAAATLTAKPKPKVYRAPPAPEKAEKKDAKARGDRGGTLLRTLSDEEYARRLEALKQAKKDEEVRRKREAEANKIRAEEESRRKIEQEAQAKVAAAEQQRRDAEEAEQKEREAEEAERAAADAAVQTAAAQLFALHEVPSLSPLMPAVLMGTRLHGPFLRVVVLQLAGLDVADVRHR